MVLVSHILRYFLVFREKNNWRQKNLREKGQILEADIWGGTGYHTYLGIPGRPTGHFSINIL